MKNANWTRDQLLVCFNFYCRTPFGKLHNRNPDILKLSELLGRSPSAVAMKLVNFASFDPSHQERNVKGLANASRLDREIWDEFNHSPNKLAIDSQESYARLTGIAGAIPELQPPIGPTEAVLPRRMRLVQAFFRSAVLVSYRYKCAFCRLENPSLLCASHIIPWHKNTELRADPRNGLSLCALHDRAFDRGLITVDDRGRILLSSRLHSKNVCPMHETAFNQIEGKKFEIPEKFSPYQSSLEYHRSNIFA